MAHARNFMSRAGALPIVSAAIAVMSAIDLVWARGAGLTVRELDGKILEIAALAVVCSIYLSFRPNRRLAEMAIYMGLWACFSTAAAVLTYLCATLDLPLRDAFFLQCDRAMGFDISSYTRLLLSHGAVFRLLQACYDSLIPQVSLTVLWLAHTRSRGRNAELLAAAMLSLVICCLFEAVMPAVGYAPADNPSLNGPAAWVPDILALRSGVPVSRSLAELQGIICFPSYHTVLALLIVWAHRRLRSFWVFATVNGLMLLSVPTSGNHYLIDMVAGLAVTVISVAAVPKEWTRDVAAEGGVVAPLRQAA